MTGIILFSVLSFGLGWLIGSERTITFMEKKFVAWLKMNDYDSDMVKKAIEEMKGILL